MTMLTVDDLARDLKVRNEDLLRELAIMGFQVDGPDSPLETDDPAALRAQLVTALPHREVIEKRIKPTVIRRRMKEQEPKPLAPEQAASASAVEVPSEPPIAVKEPPTPKPKETGRKAPRKTPRVEPAKILEKPASQLSPPSRAEEARPVRPGPPALKAPPTGEPTPGEKPRARLEAPEAKAAEEGFMEAEVTSAEAREAAEEERGADERAAKKKKKKEKRIQPAQIIGKVELKKEPLSKPDPVPPPVPSRAAPERVLRVVETPAPVTVPETTEEEAWKKSKKEKKKRDSTETRVEDDGLKVRRKREVILRDDLYDDRQRAGRLRGKGKKAKPRKTEITLPKAIKRRLKLPEVVTVSDLAHKMSIKATLVIKHLLGLGEIGRASCRERV